MWMSPGSIEQDASLKNPVARDSIKQEYSCPSYVRQLVKQAARSTYQLYLQHISVTASAWSEFQVLIIEFQCSILKGV